MVRSRRPLTVLCKECGGKTYRENFSGSFDELGMWIMICENNCEDPAGNSTPVTLDKPRRD